MCTWEWCAVEFVFFKRWVSLGVFFLSAVQSERKPIEVMPREKHINCAASTQKIYIRKDLNSPLIATPTFISDSETDASRSVLIRAFRLDLCSLHHPAFSIAALLTEACWCSVQIQSTGAGDAGEYPAAGYSEWWNFAPGHWLKGTAAELWHC